MMVMMKNREEKLKNVASETIIKAVIVGVLGMMKKWTDKQIDKIPNWHSLKEIKKSPLERSMGVNENDCQKRQQKY